jgi:hypothetical protein
MEPMRSGRSNPFFHRGPIRGRSYFYGRELETGQLLSLLNNGQSASLVGQRRIGKSSLLFHIRTPEILAQHGIRPENILLVYIDCGGLSGLDQPELYRVLLEEVADTLVDSQVQAEWPAGHLADQAPMTYRRFERALRELARQNWRLVFLLDEFDLMSSNPQLDPDFFSGLRALAARYPVAYVTASKAPLLELTYSNRSTLSSPFFNIFATLRLGLLSEDAARDLLAGLAAKEGVQFDQRTLDLLLDLAGRHPLFLQIAGYHAFEIQATREGPLTDEDRSELRRQFMTSAAGHLGYYWQNLRLEEQQILATLPSSGTQRPDLIRRLTDACLVVQVGDEQHPFCSALQDYISVQTIPGLLRAGPVTIDQGQREVLLHGRHLRLTPTQYDLLYHLADAAGQVMSSTDLEQTVWGDTYIEDPERLKSVIKGLRRALGAEASRLENVRGVGYRWRT